MVNLVGVLRTGIADMNVEPRWKTLPIGSIRRKLHACQSHANEGDTEPCFLHQGHENPNRNRFFVCSQRQW